MNIETKIHLNKFKPRPYQIPLFKALEQDKIKKIVLVWPRRAGKDIAAWNLLIRAAIKKTGIYYYCLPTYSQARRVLFEGKTNTGEDFLGFIPKELIISKNLHEMKIRIRSQTGESLIQFVGSDNFDSLRGTNPSGIIFSEYAYQHPSAYPTLRPILLANDGFAVFISTPFGENHFHQIYEIAKASPDWFCDFLTVDDTGHISREQIEKEREEGLISADMIEQEYNCSFSIGAIGSYYAKYLNKMELNDQIGNVPWQPNFKVHTAWDLGMSDQSVILWYQCIGTTINIIDMYKNSDVGMEHYINVVLNKPYTYGKHIAPHDINVRDFTGGGLRRYDKAAQLGIRFTVAPDMTIIDGIESVRTTLPRIWIDKGKCGPLISAIRDYRKEYDAVHKVYKPRPLHDHNSHLCDALRYLCISLKLVKEGLTSDELDKRYQEAIYGSNASLPSVFRDDLPNY